MSRKPEYIIHTPDEILGIREAAATDRKILDAACKAVRPGMSTLELDEYVGQLIRDIGGESAFYNYHHFPAQCCISVNDEVVHGIGYPDKPIQMGDIVSIDCGVRYKGFIGDMARTVSIGPPTGDVARLLTVTEESLMAGIAAARGGNTVKDIGAAIERVVRDAGFSIVKDYVGHGVGVNLHEPPEVPNYPTDKSSCLLRPGMVLALEPMVNIGTAKVKVDRDNWTVRTEDGSWSAHFEHMILITEGEPEILTQPQGL
jgi:methionyl aminopeptidase